MGNNQQSAINNQQSIIKINGTETMDNNKGIQGDTL